LQRHVVSMSNSKQYLFRRDNQFFLIDIWEDVWESDVVTLKIKDEGWSDTWSLSLDRVNSEGQPL
jgi:hypothetical protein